MIQFTFKSFAKLILLFFAAGLFFLPSAYAAGGSYFYYGPEGKNTFELNRNQVLIKFQNGVSFDQKAEILQKLGVFRPFAKDMEMPAPKVVLASFTKENSLDEKQILQILAELNKNPEVEYANPFLTYRDGTLEAAQNRIAVKLFSNDDRKILDAYAREFRFTVEEQYPYDKLVFFLRISKESPGNAMDIANKLFETKSFQFAEPDMLRLMKRFNTNDPDLSKQWSLNNTGSSSQYNGVNAGGIVGADMRVFSAWGISTGSSSIKVAIIDEGVDLNHPDLVANLLPGFDGTGLGSNGGPSGNDAHGTACAGIVAAVGNNNTGLAGVAYNCKIIPVRIAYSNTSGSWVTSNSAIGTSLDWAWNQGAADVLSNSWGGGSSSSLINDPITRATTQGRGGLGAPVLFAAGNSNGANSYPATLTNVVSVVAMSMCNQRKNPSSCDLETFWGSNFGTGVDVAAPGVKIYTCDISGTAGYTTGNYTASFNGTSSACPNAAGVMALILSVNPALNNTSARQILESTCDKVGGYTYNSGVSGQPNGSWSTDLGHGRVNAFSAVQAANPQPCVSPPPVGVSAVSPSTLCASGTVSLSMTGVSISSGQTYQWQSSADNSSWTNITGATNISASASASATTWYRCLVTCGGSTTPSTSSQVAFNNPTISTFPHTQNFDGSSSLPCGWTVSNVNADANTWAIGTLNSRSAPNNVTYAYNTTNAANDWLFSAPLQLTGGVTYRVRFWQRVRSATYPENLEVKWGSAASAAGMTSAAIYSGSGLVNTTYAERTGVFTPATSGIYYIGWRAFSNANMYDINIDDVTIDVNPTCTTAPVAGTASGPSVATAGTAATFSLSGWSGSGINWQSSVDNGTTWNDISGATTASVSINFNPGNYRVRARVFSAGCTDAFSNQLTLTVNPRTGDNLNLPIQIAGFPFTQSISNAAGSGFTNAYTGTNNQASPDIFYRFTTGACASQIEISSCGSGFDTYVHLLNASGTNLASNDDNGVLCTGTAGSLRFNVSPNTTYIAVFEGFGSNTGTISVSVNQVSANPVVNISANGPTTFCQGGSVGLTASSGASYLWSTGANTQSISVSASGNYSVTVTDANGCSGTASQTVTVNSNPVVSISADGPTTFCQGGSVGLTASSGASYLWSSGAATQSISASASGDYSVTVTDANGCSGTASQTVTVNSNPVVSISADGPTTFCQGGSVGLTASSGTSYLWSSGASTQSISASAGGNYSVTVTDANGCSGTALQTVTVNSNPVVSISADGPTTFCQGGSVGLTASSGASYLWSSGAATQSISVFGSGNYSVTVTDANGCSGAASQTVTVNSNPVVSISADGPTTFCQGGSVGLTASSGASYLWSSGAATQSISASASGDYSVTVTDANGCSGTASQSVIVNPSPVIYQVSGGGSYCSVPGTGASVNLSGSQAGVNYDFRFTASGSASIVAGTGAAISTLITGNGTITVTATNSSTGCSSNMSGSASVFQQTASVWFVDADGDGYGNPASSTQACSQPAGYVNNNSDCNDNASTTFPGAAEICGNGVDDDCDGQTDEGCVVYTWYQDSDADGYGNAASSITTLINAAPAGYVSNSGDCNDGSAAVNPAAAEVCNGIDDNCDGIIDNGTPSLPATGNMAGSAIVCRSTSGNSYSIDPVPGATSYLWTLPTGATGTSTTNSISLAYSSTFAGGNICVTPRNNCVSGTQRCLAVTVVTAIPTQPGVISGITAGACSTSTRSYSIAAVSGASSYNWTAPANASIVSGQGTTAVVVQFAAGFTSGNLSVTARNCVGTSTARTLALSNTTATPASITGPLTGVCAGSQQTYSTAAISGATIYTWTVPTGAIVNTGQGTNSITVTFPTPFSSGSVTVRSGTACFTSTTRSITISSVPASPASITGATVGVCAGSTQTYTCAAVTGASSYNWTIPTGAVINSGQGTNSISVSFPAGFATGNVSVTAGNACGNSTARTLAVRSTTAQPGTISGASTNLCGGGSFTYSIAAVTGATSYTWTVPAGCSITANTGTSVTVNISTSFTSGSISVVANNGCGASTARTLSLSRLPTTPASISGPTSVCPSATGLVYTTPAVSGVTTYSWTVPSGASITTGAGTNSITVNWGTVAGSVSVRAGNSCGTNTTARSLAVGLAACRTAMADGDDALSESSVRIYPNPGHGLFYLDASGISEGAELKVSDLLGKVVFSKNIQEGENQVELDKLPAGAYFFQLKGQNLNKILKVIKQ